MLPLPVELDRLRADGFPEPVVVAVPEDVDADVDADDDAAVDGV